MNESDSPTVHVHSPGRVNLIGDHTDYMDGLALPMTIQLATTITGRRVADAISLSSDHDPEPLHLNLPVTDAADTQPSWGRYVAGVAELGDPPGGFRGTVTSTIPVGAGLSSSASLTVAAALALGIERDPIDLARLCQRAENTATGVPSGIMDQLTITASAPGSAVLIDFASTTVEPVSIPDGFRFWVVDSGQRRTLDGSAYASRRADCQRAVQMIGPLRDADPAEVQALADPVLRARARHVNSECHRVERFAETLRCHDIALAGRVMNESHTSLRDDFEVSTVAIERTVDALRAINGVHGVRLTGAGFGGCVVALADPDVELPGWSVEPAGPATVRIT